jgi:4-hydroxybenzoate polyprenyltransferase
MGTTLQVLKDYWNVSRLEYVPAEGPAILVPLFLGTSSLAGLLNLLWIEAVVAFILLFTAGFIINSYNDIDVDLRWKTRVADAAKRLGKKTLLHLFIFQICLAVLISVHLSYVLNAWFILGIICLMVFFGTAYSVPPLHLKVRGVWHVVALSLSVFAIPFIFFFYVVMGSLPIPILILLVGFTIAHYAIALANQSGDFLEDRAEGLKTPAVRWGLSRTLAIAGMMTIVGLGIMLSGMFALVLSSPWLAEFEASVAYLPFAGRYLLMLIIGLILVIGYSVPGRGLFNLRQISLSKGSIKKRMTIIKTRMNYPKWQASGIWGFLLSAIIIFLITITVQSG